MRLVVFTNSLSLGTVQLMISEHSSEPAMSSSLLDAGSARELGESLSKVLNLPLMLAREEEAE